MAVIVVLSMILFRLDPAGAFPGNGAARIRRRALRLLLGPPSHLRWLPLRLACSPRSDPFGATHRGRPGTSPRSPGAPVRLGAAPPRLVCRDREMDRVGAGRVSDARGTELAMVTFMTPQARLVRWTVAVSTAVPGPVGINASASASSSGMVTDGLDELTAVSRLRHAARRPLGCLERRLNDVGDTWRALLLGAPPALL